MRAARDNNRDSPTQRPARLRVILHAPVNPLQDEHRVINPLVHEESLGQIGCVRLHTQVLPYQTFDENSMHILGKGFPEGSGVGSHRLSSYGGMCSRSFELVLVQGCQTQRCTWPQICLRDALRAIWSHASLGLGTAAHRSIGEGRQHERILVRNLRALPSSNSYSSA